MPGCPHHVTQRGNRRADVFFDDDDRRQYLSFLAKYREQYGVRIWAYCLMANHVHFVAVPDTAEALGQTFRDTHQAYSAWVNRKTRQNGHLWQGRFYSCVLDDAHTWLAVRYVERNPLRAGLVDRAEDWPWSSAAAHCGLRADELLSTIEMPWPVGKWAEYLMTEEDRDIEAIRRETRTGRPCGPEGFVQRLESALDRTLHPRKRGRKPKHPTPDEA